MSASCLFDVTMDKAPTRSPYNPKFYNQINMRQNTLVSRPQEQSKCVYITLANDCARMMLCPLSTNIRIGYASTSAFPDAKPCNIYIYPTIKRCKLIKESMRTVLCAVIKGRVEGSIVHHLKLTGSRRQDGLRQFASNSGQTPSL